MKLLRQSSIGIWLAVFASACASEPPAADGAAGKGTTATTGGTGAGASGGAAPTGGTPAAGGTSGVSSVASGGMGTSAGGTTGGAAPTGGVGSTPAGAGGTGQAGTPGTSGSGGLPPTAGTGNDGGAPPLGGAGGSAGAAGGAAPVAEPQVVTSAQNAYWKVGTVTEVTTGNADVTVNDNALQTWSGFGGTFNEKGWDALQALTPAEQQQALKLLFDPVEGANFTYGRLPIGASDYATNRYTLNDTAGDNAMNSFSIARDKQKLIPYIKAAQAVRADIHFWGSPWTPPPWMKDNNAYDRGNMKSDDANLAAYALYLAKYVEEYGKEGIAIKEIHPQNEPGFAQDYPSCGWSGALMAKFIGSHLGPTFATRNVTAQIFIGTMSNSNTDGAVLTTVMADSTAKALVKGYGLQWGMIDTYSSLGLNSSLAIWQTEHKCGNYPWVSGTNQSKAPNDQAYGVESWGLIRDWIKKGVNAYSAWNMVLDTVGRSLDTVRPWAQNALLVVDTSGKKLIPTPAYYVFRHFSQYVDPGAKVVGTSGGDAIAFKNPDGSVVAVMYNSGGAKQSIVSIGGKKLQFDMPGSGWATVNWK